MDRYDPKSIEPRWQRIWAEERTWEVPNEPDERPKAYVLEMLPYPSGELHMGHVLNYTLGDVVAHFRRRNGFTVLRPMGYDAFGLPAENHAISTGQHPREFTDEAIARLCDFLGLPFRPGDYEAIAGGAPPGQERPTAEMLAAARAAHAATYAWARDRFGDALPEAWRG